MIPRPSYPVAVAILLALGAPACSGDDPNALDPHGGAAPEDGDGDGDHDVETDDALPPIDLPDAEPPSDEDAGVQVDAGGPPQCNVIMPQSAPYIRYGLHPRASDAFAFLKVTSARITQTIGGAAASAGTHAQDGTADGRAYSAAVDLSVRDMTDAQVATFLDKLTEAGFVAFFRKPGADGWPASEARHIHAIWVAAPMKLALRNQVRDWYVGKNGLASHTTYKFKTWSTCWREAIWARYLTANPAKS